MIKQLGDLHYSVNEWLKDYCRGAHISDTEYNSEQEMFIDRHGLSGETVHSHPDLLNAHINLDQVKHEEVKDLVSQILDTISSALHPTLDTSQASRVQTRWTKHIQELREAAEEAILSLTHEQKSIPWSIFSGKSVE